MLVFNPFLSLWLATQTKMSQKVRIFQRGWGRGSVPKIRKPTIQNFDYFETRRGPGTHAVRYYDHSLFCMTVGIAVGCQLTGNDINGLLFSPIFSSFCQNPNPTSTQPYLTVTPKKVLICCSCLISLCVSIR